MNENKFNEKIKSAFEENGLSHLIDDQKAEKFMKLSDLLIETNKITNLTAIKDEDGVILKHFVDCASAADCIKEGSTVIDIGCGGGFPSLPLAIVRDDISILSLDSTGKKIDFVNKAIKELELNKSTAVCARAEEYVEQNREKFDYCISRAVARMNILSELCLPFVKIGGEFIAMKSEKGQEELAEAAKGIEILGGKHLKTIKDSFSYNNDKIERELIIISKQKPTPNQYPRKYSQILKKPL